MKNAQKRAITTALLLFLLGAGCSRDAGIIGVWKGDPEGIGLVEFHADGTLSVRGMPSNASATFEILDDNRLLVAVEGEEDFLTGYSLSGNTLELRFSREDSETFERIEGAEAIKQARRNLGQDGNKDTIVLNLRQITNAAGQFFMFMEGIKDVSEVSYHTLVSGIDDLDLGDDVLIAQPSDPFMESINPVAGEDYSALVIEKTGGTLQVTTRDGETVEHTYGSFGN